MAKLNVTLDYIHRQKADAFRYDLPLRDIPNNRRPVGRLSWDARDSSDNCTDQVFAESIQTSSLSESQFYLDTCFITSKEIDSSLWVALLNKTIVITADTWRELQPWLNNPFVNRHFRDLLLEASRVGHIAVRLEEQPHPDPQLESVIRYYVELLGFRKKIVPLVSAKLQIELGREPTEDEVMERVRPLIQDRGLKLAKKGYHEYGTDNFGTDESVLVRAVVSAISTGRETAILTRDHDLIEQFYKLMYLIDTHYRSHAIAEAYKQQPLNFIEAPFPTGSAYFDACYRSGKLIWLPDSANERFLQVEHQFVMIHVYRFGPRPGDNSLVSLGFCAERDMLPFLIAKGFTRGKNTAALGMQNLHRCVDPHHQRELGCYAALTIDNGFELQGNTIPWVDIEIALSRREQLRRVEVLRPQDDGKYSEATQASFMWANHRCVGRLTWSPTMEPIRMSPKQLAETIGFLPFNVKTYLDPSFLVSELDNQVQETVARTHCSTTRKVFEWSVNNGSLPGTSLGSRFRHKRCPPWLHQESADSLPARVLAATHSYLTLLMFRKQFGGIIFNQLEKGLGRIPSEDEWIQNLRSIKGNHVLRALDARDRLGDQDYFLEDELVNHAVLNAIFSGSDCVILTRRKVVQQQFISLIMQIDQHYRAWTLGSHDPLRRGAGKGHRRSFDPRFKRIGFRRQPTVRRISREYADSCLPKAALELQLHCWLIDGEGDGMNFIPVTFLAERPMHAMLTLRGENNGLTTNELGIEDLQFFWAVDGNATIGHVMRGESVFTSVGSADLPIDARMILPIAKVPTKDLLSMANHCDFPNGFGPY